MIGTIAMVNNLLDNRPVMERGRRIVNPKFTGLGLYTHCSGSRFMVSASETRCYGRSL